MFTNQIIFLIATFILTAILGKIIIPILKKIKVEIIKNKNKQKNVKK